MKEKIKDMMTMEERQYGRRKGWSIAVLQENRRIKQDMYMIFVDTECFDKLWLEDCLLRMKEAGMRYKEVKLLWKLLRKLNEKARIRIETPSGTTEEIEIENIVKQGTVYEPQMCCVSTVEANKLDEIPITIISAELMTKGLYVDDMEVLQP